MNLFVIILWPKQAWTNTKYEKKPKIYAVNCSSLRFRCEWMRCTRQTDVLNHEHMDKASFDHTQLKNTSHLNRMNVFCCCFFALVFKTSACWYSLFNNDQRDYTKWIRTCMSEMTWGACKHEWIWNERDSSLLTNCCFLIKNTALNCTQWWEFKLICRWLGLNVIAAFIIPLKNVNRSSIRNTKWFVTEKKKFSHKFDGIGKIILLFINIFGSSSLIFFHN